MENNHKLIQRGKRLSFLLRHDREYAFDEHGWREVNDLTENHGYTMEELEEVVATNNKQRYEFSEDRVVNVINKIETARKAEANRKKQRSLDAWF